MLSTKEAGHSIRSIYISSNRFISDVGTSSSENHSEIRNELDSHADTTCTGSNFRLYDSDEVHEVINVTGFNGSSAGRDVPIASAATLYTDPENGQQYILVFRKTLFYGNALQRSLINPNQLRISGLKVNDVPTQFDKESTHDIVVSQGGTTLRIPLTLKGIMSGFSTTLPTEEDLQCPHEIPHLEMTVDEWDPYSFAFAEKEEEAKREAVISCVAQRSGNTLMYLPRVISSVEIREQASEIIALAGEDELLHERMVASVTVSSDDLSGSRAVHALSTEDKRTAITPERLAKRFGCGLETAKRTIRTTTQLGIRNVLIPAERRTRQRTAHLRFPTMRGKTYSDTFFSTVTSTRMNKCGQMFTNGLGYDRVYPLRKKEDAHLALMADIRFAGIPEVMVTDGARS